MVELALHGRSRGALRHGGDGPVQEFLAIVLAGELYGVPLAKVREIVTPPPITKVPRAPREVLGVCSVRGLLTTVIDLRLRLSVTANEPTRRTRILLIQLEGSEVIGLLVDEVRQVMRLGEAQIELASSALGGDISEHVRGIGRPGGQSVMVLLDVKSIVVGQK
jgi:purine-binding chemotaxis protein CheW